MYEYFYIRIDNILCTVVVVHNSQEAFVVDLVPCTIRTGDQTEYGFTRLRTLLHSFVPPAETAAAPIRIPSPTTQGQPDQH